MKNAICAFIIAIIVACLVIMGLATSGYASTSKPVHAFDVEVSYSPKNFKWGELVTFTVKIKNISDKDFENASCGLYYIRNAEITELRPIGFSAKRENNLLALNIKKGEVKVITATIRPTLKEAGHFYMCTASFGIKAWDPIKRITVSGGRGVAFVILDKNTGLLGRPGELQAKIAGGVLSGIEYRYDPVDAIFFQNSIAEFGPMNKRLIAMMKKIEPALSDSEALLLHSDFFSANGLLKLPVGVDLNNVVKGAAIGEECEGVFRYMLNNGWLKAARSGKRPEWIKKETRKTGQQERGKKYFFALKGMAIPVGLILLVFLAMLKFGIKKHVKEEK